MQRRALAQFSLATIALATLGCASLPTPPGFETRPDQVAKRETAEALSRYAVLVRRQDSDAVAELFTPDGRIQHADERPVQGKAAIKRFLDQFSGYKVLSHDMTILSVSPTTTHVSQSGIYVQSVKTPDGTSVTVRGWFIMQWVSTTPGVWLIELAKTSSNPMSAAAASGA